MIEKWTIRRSFACLPLCAALLLGACGGGGGGGDGGGDGTAKAYDATITRTSMGIPHIRAKDFAGLGYGYGYAFAEDNLCVLLDDLVTIRGERSRYFGPDGSYSIPAVPVTANNVDSDFFWKLMATDAVVANLRNTARAEIRDMTRGYVAGFNRYIGELKAGRHPGRHQACATAGYLAPISEDDLYRRYFRLSIIASSSVFTNEIAQATPPLLSAGASAAAAPDPQQLKTLLEREPNALKAFTHDKAFGSNMYGLGPQATQDGQSLLFGNPHFPWSGTERLYLVHLTIPGQFDIMGSSLYGVPAVLIGFNDHLAWSHTVSTAYRFTLYQLPVNPLNPKQYFYEGQLVDMTPVPLTIDVRQADGSTAPQSRTLYRTQYGPVLEMKVAGIPVLGWDNTRVYTLRDANAENDRLMNQFFAWNTAASLDEFKAKHAEVLGVPWVNTVATGPGQAAYYGDLSVVPNVPDSLVASCKAPLLSPVIDSVAPGLPLLQGNRADCQWLNDDDAPAPGIFGAQHLPKLERQDWVANMNDSYWLTNPAAPLTGYARIIGDEDSTRSLRTRLGIRQIQRRLDGSDGRGAPKFTMQNLQDVVLSADLYSAELALEDVKRDLCPRAGIYDTSRACAALAQWNGRASPDAIGAPLWIEFWGRVAGSSGIWKNAYSSADPVGTPNGLDTAKSAVRKALHDAQSAVQDAGLDFNGRFDTQQFSAVHAAPLRIPVFGASGSVGAFTVADHDALTAAGYPVNFGNSYIQTVTWTAQGVHAEGFVTYSESSDPGNPHYADFTQRYAQKQWLHLPFSEAEIAADRQSVQQISE
ncbi:penicillin acylase family protein [Solimonas variicoloris]|uniref:penicillin acylase family protein n=1 Tax=Solimonas variicoloris TaxID=254408 RepID=UPI0003723644|nr:penicillin acylase family protein [Solimonas variicoloris]